MQNALLSVGLLCLIQNIEKIMGRGDKKTKKGKIFKGSFGKARPARATKSAKPAERKEAGSEK